MTRASVSANAGAASLIALIFLGLAWELWLAPTGNRSLALKVLPLVLPLERLMPALTAENEISTDENEIRLLARLGSQKGQIEADEAAMIAKVFQLNDLTARDLMVPRVSAPTLDGGESLDSQQIGRAHV